MKLQRHHSERDGRRLGQARVGSPEPPDVVELCAEAVERPAEVVDGSTNVAATPPDVATGSAEAADEPMKCVWSGYPDYNRDCRSRIPATVVVKAWHREIQLKGTVEGFFYFSWRSGVWLAYGLRNGGVRGVYCPTHCVDRDSRDTQGEEQRGDPPSQRPEKPTIRRAVGPSLDDAVRAARLGVALR
jgi:hypothetical protein